MSDRAMRVLWREELPSSLRDDEVTYIARLLNLETFGLRRPHEPTIGLHVLARESGGIALLRLLRADDMGHPNVIEVASTIEADVDYAHVRNAVREVVALLVRRRLGQRSSARALPTTRLRVAVIGCGYWGAKHVRVLSGLPQVAQVVAVDIEPRMSDSLRLHFPSLVRVRDLEEALPLIDAAIVATPPRTHSSIAMQLLRAGKHVLVEKPMTMSVTEAESLISIAGERSLTLMAGHTFEYNPAVRALRAAMSAGQLGDLRYIDTARLNLGLFQQDVNVVWDLAPHDVSIINFLVGGTPARVQAWGMSTAHARLEDVAYLNLRYDHPYRMLAHIHVSWLDPVKVRRMTVVGTQRMAVYDDLANEESVKIYDKGVVARPRSGPTTYRYGGIYAPYVEFHEPLRVEDEHFIQCILTGTEPLTGGASGLGVVRVLEAAQESLVTGLPVDLETGTGAIPIGKAAKSSVPPPD